MLTHIVIEGNAFYEIDEECMERRKKEKNAANQPDVRHGVRSGRKPDHTSLALKKPSEPGRDT